MTQSEVLVAPLRVLAVLLSVGIGGYLVWAAQDRQGPAPEDPAPIGDRAPELGAEPASNTPNVASDASQDAAADTAQPEVDPVMLYSSKSALIEPPGLFPPLDPQPIDKPGDVASDGLANEVDPVLLFSSKSAPINPDALESALQEVGVEVEPQPRFLPSSKVIITPEMMPKPEDRVFLSSSKSAPVHLIEPQADEPDEEPLESQDQPAEPAEEPAEKSGGSRR